MIKIYTNENCNQCEQTKRYLDNAGIEYEVKPFAEHPDELKKFIDMGFRSAPIVESDTHVWQGFDIERLTELKNEAK